MGNLSPLLMTKILDVKPYTIKDWFPFGYCIMFEEDTNLGWYLQKNDAITICAQLNGAFHLGASSVLSNL